MVLRNKSQSTVQELLMRRMWTNSDIDGPVSFHHEETTARPADNKVPSPHNGASTAFLPRYGVTDVHVKIEWVCERVLLLYEMFTVVICFMM
jgi:hypothetical protein